MIIWILCSCSIHRTNRYLTYEESVQKFFKQNYHEMHLDKYEGRLDFELNSNHTLIKLDSIEIEFNSDNSIYLELFKNRLIPSNILYTDTLKRVRVCCFEYFDYLKTPETKRRFKLLKYDERFVNPTSYYFELTNKKSNKETELITFIEGARLTYISRPILQL